MKEKLTDCLSSVKQFCQGAHVCRVGPENATLLISRLAGRFVGWAVMGRLGKSVSLLVGASIGVTPPPLVLLPPYELFMVGKFAELPLLRSLFHEKLLPLPVTLADLGTEGSVSTLLASLEHRASALDTHLGAQLPRQRGLDLLEQALQGLQLFENGIGVACVHLGQFLECRRQVVAVRDLIFQVLELHPFYSPNVPRDEQFVAQVTATVDWHNVWYRHRISQNGRSITSLGHGSSGTGASGIIRFGDPGVVGEWIWLSNRYNPPVAELFDLSLNVPARGVGIDGNAGRRVEDPPIPNWLLSGVPGDASDPSSIFETERFRDLALLRLEAENFLRRPGRARN
jgi:hypothetical protein